MTKTEKWIAKAVAVHGDRYDYSKVEYTKSKNKVLIICKEHGEFIQEATNHLQGHGCPECGFGISRLAKLKNLDWFVEQAAKTHGELYDYSKSVFKNTQTKLTVTCKKHGEFLVTPSHHLYSKSGCPACVPDINRLDADEFFEECNRVHNNRYDYSKAVYVRVKDEIEIICPIHGSFWQTGKNHKKGIGCKACHFESVRSNTDEFVRKAKDVHGDKYTYENAEYRLCSEKVSVTCPKHGDFLVTPSNHLLGHGCKYCFSMPTVSSHEFVLRERYPQAEFSNRNLIGKELDLLFAESGLGIEVNGRFWHSEYNGKSKDYHLEKTERCLEKGMTLLHFWEDEVVFKQPIVESMIDARLGKSTKIYARNTEVREVPVTDTKQFLSDNHLQGSAQALAAYGLFSEGLLVSVMTFAKPRFNKSFEYEIIRYATKINLTVVGGSSKLFKAFVKDYQPSSVITYADRRYSEGKVYETIGFSFSKNSKPSYFYTKGNKNLSRYSCQKHKLQKLLGDKFDPDKSEHENMFANGWYRVYDCGSKVFTWHRP